MGLRQPLTPARSRRRKRLLRTIGVTCLLAASAGFALREDPADSFADPVSDRIVVPASGIITPQPPTPPPTPVPTSRPATAAPAFAVAPGSTEVSGSGPVRRFVVEVEEGLGIDPSVFAGEVQAVLWDNRSWGGSGRLSFRRVAEGGSFRITLATPETTRRLCRPLDTGRTLSCYQRGRAVLNVYRWQNGSVYFPDLGSYRAYMVNHEVGHALGHGHRGCPASGELAPVMMQQTKGLEGCRPNGWPLGWERG